MFRYVYCFVDNLVEVCGGREREGEGERERGRERERERERERKRRVTSSGGGCMNNSLGGLLGLC